MPDIVHLYVDVPLYIFTHVCSITLDDFYVVLMRERYAAQAYLSLHRGPSVYIGYPIMKYVY